jgi:dienelactone hydrolase
VRFTTRTLILLSVLAAAACGSPNDGPNISGPDGGPLKAGIYSLFDPNAGTIPFPFDGLFAGFNDPTLNIPNPKGAPFVDAANLQDGFSTTASAFTDFIGFVDFTSATTGLLVVDGSTGAPLHPGTDYKLQTSTAKDDATGVPISEERTRILIEPLKPLKPSTTYLVAVTTGVKSKDGVSLVPSDAFKVVRSGVAVTGSANAQDTDTANPNYPFVKTLTAAQKAKLEAVRSQLIRPVIQGLMAGTGLPEAAFAIAWSFTTQSTAKTLTAMNAAATATAMGVKATGLTTHDANPALPPVADLYIGTLKLPYYLSSSGGNIHSTAPLTNYWLADQTKPDANARFLGKVPCGAFFAHATLPDGQSAQPSVSTTICFPVPQKRSDETVPVLATVPNANSGKTMPAAGWPLVIFQHGITGNRSQMLAIAPTLAAAGFVTVAIDLPLHGLPPPDPANPAATDLLYNATGGIERTFNLDLSNNSSGAPGPDGKADPSGTYFINLSSLLTSRDNLRQAVSDLVTLTKSTPSAVFLNQAGNGLAGVSIDASKIYFVGHSLGGIVGGTLLGVNTDIKAATLAMPGGGIAKLLDASLAFGPRIAAGLAASGVNKGTDLFETFLRFAQTAVDSGDPINFAVAARANHPIHMIEVIGDTVVPNNALAGSTASIPGYLSGTDPLYQIMGLTVVGPLSVPIAAQAPLTGASLGVVAQFAQGNHGSILDPSGSATNAAVTCEMQRQTASFLATGGTVLPVGGTCP